ncbi:MAG: VOC family protein [Pseudomonadales bacterium]|jgi:catechol 2,3-dioxygenase-like lactoylglutathione lyase family enzyme|nr:VOC family protein [Pseudomonadales bacterium]
MIHANPLTQGIHHAGFSVPDLAATAAFFIDTLNFTEVGAKPDYPALFLSDGTVMVTLWQLPKPEQANAFDRHQNVGLHHFALTVNDLDEVHARLEQHAGVGVEFRPEPLGGSSTRHGMYTIPGGLRVEFIQSAAA